MDPNLIGLVVLQEEIPDRVFSLCWDACRKGHMRTKQLSENQEERLSQQPTYARTFPDSRTVRNIFLLFEPFSVWCFVSYGSLRRPIHSCYFSPQLQKLLHYLDLFLCTVFSNCCYYNQGRLLPRWNSTSDHVHFYFHFFKCPHFHCLLWILINYHHELLYQTKNIKNKERLWWYSKKFLFHKDRLRKQWPEVRNSRAILYKHWAKREV